MPSHDAGTSDNRSAILRCNIRESSSSGASIGNIFAAGWAPSFALVFVDFAMPLSWRCDWAH